ncbi:MAG: DUF3305 domain-containing protein [Litoreibacter sp.]|nr:DUF3305 domain-containing protein [Litoreibacter sp.]
MYHNPRAYNAVPIGVVLRRTPGVTRWQKYAWSASAVLPGAAPAHWHELRRDGDAVEYHASTETLELHGAEAEAYLHGLQSETPSVYVIIRQGEGEHPLDVVLVTASPYEAQDYTDSGEEIVEKVAMPPLLRELVKDFVDRFYEEEAFVKRKRDKRRVDLVEDGIGDPRIGKAGDIYASPAQLRRRVQ